MTSNRLLKKQNKQLIREYHRVVNPIESEKRIILPKEVGSLNQAFEVFSLYKTSERILTSNKTQYLTKNNNSLDA